VRFASAAAAGAGGATGAGAGEAAGDGAALGGGEAGAAGHPDQDHPQDDPRATEFRSHFLSSSQRL